MTGDTHTQKRKKGKSNGDSLKFSLGLCQESLTYSIAKELGLRYINPTIGDLRRLGSLDSTELVDNTTFRYRQSPNSPAGVSARK